MNAALREVASSYLNWSITSLKVAVYAMGVFFIPAVLLYPLLQRQLEAAGASAEHTSITERTLLVLGGGMMVCMTMITIVTICHAVVTVRLIVRGSRS